MAVDELIRFLVSPLVFYFRFWFSMCPLPRRTC
uniref:Uncharacterized protein n=1 Tax=Rhizophora mucronata TaxID=61149 RepID=A0A2P2IZH5_RHIMU